MQLSIWGCGPALVVGPPRVMPVTGPKALSSLQGEPQSLATIFQLVSQACESAIQSEWGPAHQPTILVCRAGSCSGWTASPTAHMLKLDSFLHEKARPPMPIMAEMAEPGRPGPLGIPRLQSKASLPGDQGSGYHRLEHQGQAACSWAGLQGGDGCVRVCMRLFSGIG